MTKSSCGRWCMRVLGIAVVFASLSGAHASVVYSNIYNPLPANTPSYGYAANGIDELFDKVNLAPGGRNLQSITLSMSDWAVYSDYSSTKGYANTLGYNQALTVDFYDGATGRILLGSKTITTLIPWRPETTPNCAADPLNPQGYGPSCLHGVLFDVTFDFSDQNIVLPDSVYFGLMFNTQVHGDEPTGKSGPYNQLNLAIGPGATIGSEDLSYSAVNVAAQIVAIPEPSTVTLLGVAVFGLFAATRRRSRR